MQILYKGENYPFYQLWNMADSEGTLGSSKVMSIMSRYRFMWSDILLTGKKVIFPSPFSTTIT